MNKPVLRSILLMAGGVALLTANDAATKYLVHSYPVGQVVCLRQAATMLVMLLYLALTARWGELRVRSWGSQFARGLLFVIGSVFIVWSLGELPLATAVTMLFVSPIFMVALSAPLLGERIGRHRWIAVLGGFAGVLIIMRPGSTAFQWALLLPVIGALVNALRDVWTRRLSRTETSMAILFWSSVILMLAGAATLPFGWAPLTAPAVFWFFAAGLFNGVAHFLIIEALRHGEASMIAPVRYTALLWAAAIGFVVWGDVPGVWLWLGAAVIVSASLYMINGERRRA